MGLTSCPWALIYSDQSWENHREAPGSTPKPAVFSVGPIRDRLGHLPGPPAGGDPISAAGCSHLWTGALAGASEHLDPASPAPGLAGSDHRSADGLRAARL